MKIHGQEFPNVFRTTTAEIAATRKEPGAAHWDVTSSEMRGMSDWLLGDMTASAAQDAMRTGGTSDVEPLTLPTLRTNETRELRTVKALAGATWNVGALVRGEPHAALAFRRVVGRKRLVRLAVDSFVSGGTRSEALTRRGRAIAGLVLALKRAGVELEIMSFEAGKTAAHDISDPSKGGQLGLTWFQVDVHRPGRVLDTRRVVWWLAHQAAQRWARYGWMEQTTGIYNYSPIAMESLYASMRAAGWTIAPSAVLFESGQYATDEGAREWVRSTVAGIVGV